MGVLRDHSRTFFCAFSLAALLLVVPAVPYSKVSAEVQTRFLYKLANFSGRIDTTWARISVDPHRNEIYLIDKEMVRVFDDNGMEIHRFGEDGRFGVVMDVAVRKSGDMLVLSRDSSGKHIRLCDFRGIFIERFALKQLPDDFAGLAPDQMVLRGRRLYFVSNGTFQLVVTDENGRFRRGYDLAELLKLEDAKRGITQIDGFSVDSRGNVLFTVPVTFSAHVLSPAGELTSYIQPGGAPGKFNLVSGIAADSQGYYYIADRLKDVVQIFDESFSFIRQFGYRGPRSNNLFGPRYLAFDSQNRLHVSQVSRQGVSVFQVNHQP